MDWVSTWDNLSGQGIMFWSATVAVALGITLILTAGHLQWRRLRARPSNLVPARPDVEPAAPLDPRLVPSGQENGRENHPPNTRFQANSQSADQVDDRREMGVLMARLHSAADKLSEYHRSRLQIPAGIQDSRLKEDRNGVEYLFRAGKG